MDPQQISYVKNLPNFEGKPDYRKFDNFELYVNVYYDAFKKSEHYFRNFEKFEGAPDHEDYDSDESEEFQKDYDKAFKKSKYYFRNFEKFEGCPNHEDYSEDQVDKFQMDYENAVRKMKSHPKNWPKFQGSPNFESFENEELFAKAYEKAYKRNIEPMYPSFEESPDIKMFSSFEEFEESYREFSIMKSYYDFDIENRAKNFNIVDYPPFPNSNPFSNEFEENIEAFILQYCIFRKNFLSSFKNFPGCPKINPDETDEDIIKNFIIEYNIAYQKFKDCHQKFTFSNKPNYKTFQGSLEEYQAEVKIAWKTSKDNPKNWEQYPGCPKYSDYDDMNIFVLDYNRGYYALPEQVEKISNLKRVPKMDKFKSESDYYIRLEKLLNKQKRRVLKEKKAKEYKSNNRAVSISVYNSYEIRDSFMRSDFGAIMGNSDVDEDHNRISYENCMNGFIHIKGTVGEGVSFHPIIFPFKDSFVYKGGFINMIDNLDIKGYEKSGNGFNGLLFKDIIFDKFDVEIKSDIHTLIFNRAVILEEINPIFTKCAVFEFCQSNCDFIERFLLELLKTRKEKVVGTYFRIIDCNITDKFNTFVNDNLENFRNLGLMICFNQCIFTNFKVKEGKVYEKREESIFPKCTNYQNFNPIKTHIYDPDYSYATVYNFCTFEEL